MAKYDFSTLNSTDLEELVCDLLNADQPEDSRIRYKTFKEGRDQGIDLLYSTEQNQHEHIGQVKHYYRTGYKGLIKDLRDNEVEKVKKLNPGKYLFATSVDLGVSETKEIKKVFTPYIKDCGDIYGKGDLNRLIEKTPNILDTHFKLWLSDFSIVKKILNSDLDFKSSYLDEESLKRRLRRYVETVTFNQANKILEEKNFILITGEPGLGKTTLAEMLIYEYLANDFSLTYVVDDIKDVERAIALDKSKQIFYYDDFLGSNEVEINKARGRETTLIKVLNRISSMENKKMIFTTRSFLLSSAVEASEKLKKFNRKAKTSTIKLPEYDFDVKRKIFFSHLEDSELDDDLKNYLGTEETMQKIISHPNFSPRIIEYITDVEVVDKMSVKEYSDFLFSSLQSQEEIWEYAYTKQINEDDRLLLNTLYSFDRTPRKEELEQAFMARLQLEVEKNNKKREMYAYLNALKRLNGGFLLVKNEKVSFINPSLIDFLKYYLQKDKDELSKITQAIACAAQLNERFFSLAGVTVDNFPEELQKKLVHNFQTFLSEHHWNYDLIQIAIVINNYCKVPEKDEVIHDILYDIDDWNSLHHDFQLNFLFRKFISSIQRNSIVKEAFQERMNEIIPELVAGENDISESIYLLEKLIEKFEVNTHMLETNSIFDHFDVLFTDLVDEEIQWLRDWMTDESEAREKEGQIEKLILKIRNLGFDYSYNLDEFDIDWHEVAMENEFRRLMEKDD